MKSGLMFYNFFFRLE